VRLNTLPGWNVPVEDVMHSADELRSPSAIGRRRQPGVGRRGAQQSTQVSEALVIDEDCDTAHVRGPERVASAFSRAASASASSTWRSSRLNLDTVIERTSRS
jgi:hypothetical protein